jgi:hypothetical protein
MRRIVALALLLAPLAAEEEMDTLPKAREEFAFANGQFRKLPRIERDAIRDARETVAGTAKGRALAPAFLAAADALEAVRKDAGDLSGLLGQMALSYRAMADELDKAVALEMKAKVAALLKEAADEKGDEDTNRAWRIVKKGDPRYRAIACNMKAIGEALATLDEQKGEVGQALAKVKGLHKALEPMFDGVETARPEPPGSDCPT